MSRYNADITITNLRLAADEQTKGDDTNAYIQALSAGLKDELRRLAEQYNDLLAKYEALGAEHEAVISKAAKGTVVPMRRKNDGGSDSEPLPPAS